MPENFCKKYQLCFACREQHHPWCCKFLKSNAPQPPGVPSAGFTVTRAEANKTLPDPQRDLRRFLGATFHISHAVTLWGWCRLNACALLLLLLALCRAGNCLPCIPSWEPSPSCAALLSAHFSSLCAALELCLFLSSSPHEFCLSISKVHKEDSNIIGQNAPKWAFQLL